MDECERFGIAIEQELRGGLDEAARAGLEQHLARCEACRAWQARVRGLERTMGAAASGALQQVDWARVEEGMRRSVRRRLAAAGFWGVLGALFVPLYLWNLAQGSPAADGLPISLASGGLLAALAGWALLRARRDARLASGELLAAWRRQVTAGIRTLRAARVLLAAVGAWNLLLAFGFADARLRAVALLAGGLALLVAGWAHRVKLPSLLREQAELDRTGQG